MTKKPAPGDNWHAHRWSGGVCRNCGAKRKPASNGSCSRELAGLSWDTPDGATQSGVLLTMEEAREVLAALEYGSCLPWHSDYCDCDPCSAAGVLRSKGVRLEGE